MDEQNLGQVAKEFLDFYKPTPQDLAYMPTDDELKELCLRHKCYVSMHRFNILHDIKTSLEEEGRLKNMKPEQINRFLIKCVKRYKNKLEYNEQIIRKIRFDEWCVNKKDSLLLLELWEYERKKQQQSRHTLFSIQHIMDMSIENVRTPEKLKVYGKQQNRSTTKKSKNTNANANIENQPPSSPSIVLNNISNKNTHKRQDILHNFLEVNTESMEIGSQSIVTLAESQSTQPTQPATPGASQDREMFQEMHYMEFDVQVPATSTQQTEPEDFEV